jgi:alpha-L-arabinofuranosidase
LTLFALNRHLSEEMPLGVRMDGFAGIALDRALTLHDSDLTAVNTKTAPDRVKPSPLAGVKIDGASLQATLPPASWTMIRLQTAKG